MEKKIQEFKGDEDNYIILSNNKIYVNIMAVQKNNLLDKIRNSESEITLSEDSQIIDLYNIEKLCCKKRSKSIDINCKNGEYAFFEADSILERDKLFNAIHLLIGDNYLFEERKYTIFRRIVTPALYTLMSTILGGLIIWLATAQPEIVKRTMIVKRSVYYFIESIQWLENIGAKNANIVAGILIGASLVYMVLRLVKPPIKLVIESH